MICIKRPREGCQHIRLINHLTKHQLLDKFQSAHHRHHSTETEPSRIPNGLRNAVDSGSMSSLVLFDLSAVFDTVDYGKLLQTIQQHIGIDDGTAPSWFCSYLTVHLCRVKTI